MKKTLVLFSLSFVCLCCFAEWQDGKNGWKYFNDSFRSSQESGPSFYTIDIDDSTKVSLYFDVTSHGDTLCEFLLNQVNQNGEDKIFSLFDRKLDYFYNVFLLNTEERFSAVKFSYDEENKFTTGFNPDGLGQNKLACSILRALLNGGSVKFVVMPAMEEWQEIKEFILPSLK